MAPDIALLISGVRYTGVETIRVTRSIESIAGGFAFQVYDRWGLLDRPWPIAEEDPCTVVIDGTNVLDGWIDKRSLSASSSSRTLTYTGRDRAAVLVDCAPTLKQWTYYKLDVAAFVTKLAARYDIKVTVQPGLSLPAVPKFVVSPGETAFEAIRRACEPAGVLTVSDGNGGLIITRAGAEHAYTLVEGKGGNILSASVDYDGADRFRTYSLLSQIAGTDEAFGAATQTRATATDLGVRRANRETIITSEKGYDSADARRRADWEARMRAAKAEQATVTVQGWRQGNGVLWAPNATTHVTAPRMIGVNGDMIISEVEYSLDQSEGTRTTMKLVRPDAFDPEPTATLKPASGYYKDLGTGPLK